MKTLPLLAAILALPLCSCSYLPPTANAPATTKQAAISGDLQSVANAIRHAENAGFTPEQFNHFLETWVALIPMAGPYIPDAELAYAIAYKTGNISATGLEALARRYDS